MIFTVETSTDARVLSAVNQAKELARGLRFSEADQVRIATAVSELASNILIHAMGKGRIIMDTFEESGRVGVLVVAEDQGPGIQDVEQALEGKSSSTKGLGVGLGAAKRLMDEFHIETELGKGTRITAKKWRP